MSSSSSSSSAVKKKKKTTMTKGKKNINGLKLKFGSGDGGTRCRSFISSLSSLSSGNNTDKAVVEREGDKMTMMPLSYASKSQDDIEDNAKEVIVATGNPWDQVQRGQRECGCQCHGLGYIHKSRECMCGSRFYYSR